MKEHENLDLTRALYHTTIKNPRTESSLTVFLKTILHNDNFQNVLSSKEPCAKQRLLTHTHTHTNKHKHIYTHCFWLIYLKTLSNILFICLYLADQQLMGEIKNDPGHNTFHRIPKQPQHAHLIQFTGLITDYPNNPATYSFTSPSPSLTTAVIDGPPLINLFIYLLIYLFTDSPIHSFVRCHTKSPRMPDVKLFKINL